jgi:hypothetical protein
MWFKLQKWTINLINGLGIISSDGKDDFLKPIGLNIVDKVKVIAEVDTDLNEPIDIDAVKIEK